MKNVLVLVNHWSQKLYILIFLGLVSATANSQPSLPNVGFGGEVSAETNLGDLIVAGFKYAIGIALWIAVAWFGFLMLTAVIKAASDANNGREISWAEAGKSMLGNVLVFVVFLAIALWYSAAFLA